MDNDADDCADRKVSADQPQTGNPSAKGGEVSGAESTTATSKPQDVSEAGKAAWDLATKWCPFKPSSQ